MEKKPSHVLLHRDGYVEVVFIGLQSPDMIKRLIDTANGLVDQHGPMAILVNGKAGKPTLSPRSLQVLVKATSNPKLSDLIILMTKDHPEGVTGPTIISSILRTILGFNPKYIAAEEEARMTAVGCTIFATA